MGEPTPIFDRAVAATGHADITALAGQQPDDRHRQRVHALLLTVLPALRDAELALRRRTRALTSEAAAFAHRLDGGEVPFAGGLVSARAGEVTHEARRLWHLSEVATMLTGLWRDT